MSGKALVWGSMFVDSSIGSLVPYFWNGGIYSYSIWGAIGGLIGIWAGFKLAKATGAL
ncbi:MAG: hypothetical protein Q8L52_03255 [bacterium]|nr:hypothetical protein [bacterium]